MIEYLILSIKTKIVCAGLYENTFFALLATEDTCAVRVAYTATFIESFCGNVLVAFERKE